MKKYNRLFFSLKLIKTVQCTYKVNQLVFNNYDSSVAAPTCFPDFFTKENNFYDFLFASLDKKNFCDGESSF